MAKRNKTEYIFADSYIGNFTRYLMTRKDLMRVAASRDLETADAVLREFGYEESKELKAGDIDQFLHREEERLHDIVFSTVPDPQELAFNLYPSDFHNAKVCLKAEALGQAPNPAMLSDAGSIPAEQMQAGVRERSGSGMPEGLKAAIAEAADTFGRGHDPQSIDLILDKACYKQMLDDVSKMEEPFLEELVRRQIDAVNLGLFVRFRSMGKPWSAFKDLFIAGGNIPLQILIASYEEAYSRVGERMSPYGFQKAFAEGGKAIKENGSFGLFERLRDDAVMDHVRKAKYEPFGIVPIEGFWFAKHQELANLRVALMGSRFGFDPDEIEERIREPYV